MSCPPTARWSLDRTLVVGTSCCGKTTLARRLGGILGSRHIELDALHWGPDWTAKPDEEFRSALAEAVSAERWITDGNYGTVRDLLWPRATAVIWLNYSFRVVFGRALYRTLRRSLIGERIYSGNRETLARAFLRRDSILLWVLQTYQRRRRAYREFLESNRYPQLQWIELRTPREAEAFLTSLAREHAREPTGE